MLRTGDVAASSGRVLEWVSPPGSSHGPRLVWLDCDPGHDDAMAIMLAGHDPRLRLIGVSTVAGNQVVQVGASLPSRILLLLSRSCRWVPLPLFVLLLLLVSSPLPLAIFSFVALYHPYR